MEEGGKSECDLSKIDQLSSDLQRIDDLIYHLNTESATIKDKPGPHAYESAVAVIESDLDAFKSEIDRLVAERDAELAKPLGKTDGSKVRWLNSRLDQIYNWALDLNGRNVAALKSERNRLTAELAAERAKCEGLEGYV